MDKKFKWTPFQVVESIDEPDDANELHRKLIVRSRKQTSATLYDSQPTVRSTKFSTLNDIRSANNRGKSNRESKSIYANKVK